jgi:hypothetical protein
MKSDPEIKLELKAAKKIWPGCIKAHEAEQLGSLVRRYRFSVKEGDLQILNRHWYVTHTGLLGLAYRKRCWGAHTEPVQEFCEPASFRWAFKAVVYKSRTCKGFVGYGDADPSNVSPLVRGAEMRVAETRAVNRALRKAYGIGICSVEEIISMATRTGPQSSVRKLPPESSNNNGHDGNGTRVRDRLCQLIRQHKLDAELVKAYAVDFCGTKTLREASREQVENFVAHLADCAEKDRNALLCRLNSYVREKAGAA